jgi:hypothetical protein
VELGGIVIAIGFVMKIYSCDHCGNPLYFENNQCLNCGRSVGFDPGSLAMHTLKAGGPYRYCKNAEYGVCNWLVGGGDGAYCVACELNRTIPALEKEDNLRLWKSIEVAKHRLIYSLLRLRLPFRGSEDLVFDFLADGSSKVMTGHEQGVITLNIEEADEAARVRNRLDLGERYRTLLGHFRHESGHYYWDLLVRDRGLVEGFGRLFGDEQADYGVALQAYYSNGAPADWMQRFISPYATSHPWEDWAETWAHYLHMMDTLETAWAFGIRINAVEVEEEAGIRANVVQDPYEVRSFDRIIKGWLPLCFAVNSLNRSMGHGDFYPFVLSAPVVEKLRFIHGVVNG